MNGPRSNNFNLFANESTIETLSRTIEDLEKKILGATNSSQTHAQGRGQFAGRQNARSQSNAQPGFPQQQNLRDEVRFRQQSLSGGGSQAFPRGGHQGFSQSSARPQPNIKTQSHQSSGDLAALLSQLRHELKHDMQSAINGEISQLQNDIMELRHAATDPNVPSSLGSDLEQIAQSLKQLGSGPAPEQHQENIDSLRLEVDSLRNLVDKLAREDTLVGLDNRWNTIEQSLKSFDPNIMKGEFSDLTARLNDMRLALANMHKSTPTLRPLEEKIEHISSAVAELMGRPDHASGYDHFAEFTSQTDERLEQLTAQIEMLAARGENDLADRIEAISTRINALSNEDAFQNLEARMAHLQTTLDNTPSEGHMPEVSERLKELSNKVDAFDGRSSTVETAGIERLVSQLTDIAMHLDERAKPVEISGLDRLEEQIQQLNDRLEISKDQPQAEVEGLQEQIEQLSEAVRNSSVGDVSEKLDNLAEHLSTNDEFVLEAAKQAAEAALEAYDSDGMSGSVDVSDADGQVISSLVGELRKLEDLQRSNEDRSAKAFDTVQQSLVKIVDGLERLNNEVNDGRASEKPAPRIQVTPVKADAPKAAMPKVAELATQSVEEHVAPSLAPEDIPAERHSDQSENEVEPENNARAETDQETSGQDEQDEPKGANSLLAGLASRMKTAIADKNDGKGTQGKSDQQSASANALDELESEFADEPLEPGSGAPDISSIMQKVRDVQKSRGGQEKEQDADPQELVSSARRAALAAAAEVQSEEQVEPPKRRFRRKGSADNGPMVRKPILVAVGAILVAILAFPVVKQVLDFGGISPQSETVIMSQNIAKPVQPNLAVTDGQPAIDRDVQTGSGTQLAENSAPRIVNPPITEEDDVAFVEPQEQDILAPRAETNIIAEENTASIEQPEIAALAPDNNADIQNANTSAFAGVNDLPAAIASGGLKQAAMTGDATALYEIGSRFADGRGTDPSYANAKQWFELSADQNFAPAQYRLGNMYEKGEGVERDLDKAQSLYLQSANNGNVSAMHNLGVLYASSGSGDEMTKAAEWFRQAADFGVRDSQVNMAILYARGEGVPRDLVESYKWFAIAATGGDEDAAAKRDQVLNALPPDRSRIAQEKVSEWQANPVDNLANSVKIPDAWVGPAEGTASIDMKKAIRNIQAILNNNGFDAGVPDGIIGNKTTGAIKAFQTSIGMEPNGQISDQLVQELLKRNS